MIIELTLVASMQLLLGQNVVTPKPESTELNRYSVLALDSSDITLKLDSATGVTWKLCAAADKKSGAGVRWCPLQAKGSLPAGPAGRYSMVTDNALRKQPSVFLVDSVSGRSWVLCTSPVSEKQQAWCSLDE